ncbi:MAG: hypothetical protein QOG04_1933 [Actinomycetota bacterium]|jgi:hypothetical protein|nr:hypothetical protein [Actinomycetota bacterium]
MAQALAAKGFTGAQETVATRIDRRLMDRLISWTGALMALAMVALGAAAIYGGSFAVSNVRDRLAPQNITFPPAEAMSDFDKTEGLTAYAGQKVDTGSEAEAFSRYIGGHLAEVNEGATYSETSSESRAYAAEVGEDPTAAESAKMAELSGKVDTLFRGETLRGMLLNAYGWGTVGLITTWAGFGMVAIGIVLALFAALGFRHARRTNQS